MATTPMTVITHTPDVLDGKPRIEGTRIGVLHIHEMVREAGYTKEETAAQLDIDLEDVEHALEFYDTRPAQMRAWEQEKAETLQKAAEAEQ